MTRVSKSLIVQNKFINIRLRINNKQKESKGKKNEKIL